MGRFWKSTTAVGAVGVAVLLVVGLLVGSAVIKTLKNTPASASPTTSTINAPTSTTSTTASPQVDLAVVSAISVFSTDVDCPTVVAINGGTTVPSGNQTVVKYDIGALKPVSTSARLWSDALSTPISTTDPAKGLAETQAAICEDPLLGSAFANMFANMSIGDIHVVEHNSWLKPFQGDPTGTINAQAAGFIPLLDVTTPTVQQQQAAVSMNLEWQDVAEHVDTLLERFAQIGVKTDQSVMNLHLAAKGIVVGGLPPVETNPNQEKLPAFELALTVKGGCVPEEVIGVNKGDKRPMVFATPRCVTPPPPPSSTVMTTPRTTPTTRSTTVTTMPTHQTTTTSTTVVICGRKGCYVATTIPPPPTTIPPRGTTTTTPGPPPTVPHPTTTEKPPSPPTTTSPTTNPPPPGV